MPISPLGWVLRGALFLAIAIPGLLFQADREARSRISLAAILPVGLGGFADERMAERLALEDPAVALRHAEGLLRHRPIDAHNLGIYALTAVEADHPEKAAQALTAASTRGWRGIYTQMSIAGSAIAQERWEAAALRLDALARMRSEQDTIFAALAYLLENSSGRQELSKRLNSSEPLAAMMAEYARIDDRQAMQIGETLAMSEASGSEMTCQNYARAVRALLVRAEGEAALRGWPERCRTSASKTFEFTLSSAADDPFAWTFPDTAGLSVRDGENDGTIDIRNRDPLRREAATRYLALAPGSYTLKIDRDRSLTGSARPVADLHILLRCDRRAGRSSGALVDEAYVEQISFAVDANCRTQFLSLTVSQGRADNVSLSVSRLRN
ncbi:hypothetical protein E3U23_10455 [Erythrobacter litoralis]|uniref:hypothetical protein n=1 Tax=Erythrobacter litoralis TaxID=39960 RepID=UPI002435989B|nr:hypothetical protein [Erythrobacter litoralis]MDG6079615.1 hypothetical protein [Erythrobacter litoralis]